ncbi:hypothetical protein R70723_11120 [Paenibacillus sp. FSL R7-0273]|uniref:helix-turn-helix transcriptional regulator n=1 Tax=Paenibacillus sp. FSL R7-0273 TaxID=1536772 RepID=UPI0004F5EBEB|nr:AraC family transcriptional regulator [Paenibacillus sp. FSL R7-0273]AIQ46366.1 hypothetical protein R70723_11120 [Paenibacillus sp. FSL R7-0273]OMF86436.1 hypothetical protein BK144_25930 [Paenibacillus sp. FSL R7-0273]
MVEISLKEEQLPGSLQVKQLQESFLLDLIREDWLSTEQARARLRQLKLPQLAAEGLRLRFAAAELKLPPEELSPASRRRQHAAGMEFQLACREAAAGWKHIYPFASEANPLQLFFLIPAKEGAEHTDRAGRFMEELERRLGSSLKYACTVTAGVELKGLKRLKNAFVSCLCALGRSSLAETQQVEGSWAVSAVTWLSADEERRLLHLIGTADTFAFGQELDALFEAGRQEAPLSDLHLYQGLRVLHLLAVTAGKFAFRGTALSKYVWNSHSTLAACTNAPELKAQLSALALLVMEEVRLARQSPERALAEALRRYIERNYGWELQPALAARLFGMEEDSLLRHFKQHVGMQLADYAVKIRMGRAEQLLPDASLKLNDLALLVGYDSPGHFVSAFKKYSGRSPKEYRERYQRSR